MTHAELVKRAVKWLDYTQRCTIVINELTSFHTNEIPDAIGFKGGISTLIECKYSRADFFRDNKKPFRIAIEFGMGNFRYFMTPVRLIKPDELPPMWGLLEAHESQIRIKHKAEMFEDEAVNKHAEVAFLTSVIRRLEISTAVFVRYENEKYV